MGTYRSNQQNFLAQLWLLRVSNLFRRCRSGSFASRIRSPGVGFAGDEGLDLPRIASDVWKTARITASPPCVGWKWRKRSFADTAERMYAEGTKPPRCRRQRVILKRLLLDKAPVRIFVPAGQRRVGRRTTDVRTSLLSPIERQNRALAEFLRANASGRVRRSV